MKNKRLIRGISAILICALVFACFANANLESHAENQIVDQFYVLDENGNPVPVVITQEDVERAATESEKYTVEISNETEQAVIGEYNDLEEANETYQSAVEQSQSANTYTSSARSKRSVETAEGQDISLLDSDGNVLATTKSDIGVVRFKRVKDQTISYTEVDTGRKGYLSAFSTGDAAYIRTEGNYVICKVSGVVIKVNESDCEIHYTTDTSKISYYSVVDGYLIHTYTYYSGDLKQASTRVGYKPSYMENGKKYYSYDGHYFYASFEEMIGDYRNNNYNHAINKNTPYYNYYQYLSFHTTAPFSGSQYDQYVKNVKGSSSVMTNTGNSFVSVQNKYTINALMMFGVAINESGWGTSSIAKNKNNLFGLNAVDSDAYGSADTFYSLESCIENFAYGWMHKGYLDGLDSRYRGPHLGDKHSGINVKYASDPYWGEKAAARGYYFDTAKQDYGRYTIGIAKSGNINFYKEASTSSTRIYTSEAGSGGNLFDFPVVILGKETGANGTVFYKVISDISLTDDRNGRNVSAIFNPYRDYLYVKASDINIVFNGNGVGVVGEIEEPDDVVSALFLSNSDNYLTGFSLGGDVSSMISRVNGLECSVILKKADGTSVTSGILATGMTMTITVDGTSKSYTVVIRGDVSGDGKLSAIDYVKVRNYLDGSSSLKDAFLKGADTSGDSKVTAIDYVKLRNHLDNKSTISQY